MIQYYHANDKKILNDRKRRTFCFRLPEYYFIETEAVKSITDNNYIPVVSIAMGVSTVHPNDQYKKSIGREVSFSNLELTEFYMVRVQNFPRDNETIISLVSLNSGEYTVKLKMNKEFNTIRVLAIY